MSYIIRAQVWDGQPKNVKYFNAIDDQYVPGDTIRQHAEKNPAFMVDLEARFKYSEGMTGPLKFRQFQYRAIDPGKFTTVGEDEFTLEEAGWTTEEINTLEGKVSQ